MRRRGEPGKAAIKTKRAGGLLKQQGYEPPGSRHCDPNLLKHKLHADSIPK